MNKTRVAFQGSKGAYSEMALYEYFDKKVEAIGFELSEQVCEAVRDDECQFGILPVENSIVGNVDVNTDLFFEHDIYAIGEEFLQINHRLLGIKNSNIRDIKTVYSHPVALAQCRDFLNRHKIKGIAAFDTAGSCETVLHKKDKSIATIASSACIKYYGLSLIEEHIQKEKNNITRFLIFKTTSLKPEKIKEEKTSLAFNLKHEPGSLLNGLKKFANHGINLTKLESRPVTSNPFVYTFFVDIDAPLSAQNVQKCLKELKEDTQTIKVLGSYPKGKIIIEA